MQVEELHPQQGMQSITSVLIDPKLLKRRFKGQFSPKNLKLGQKSGPSVQNSQNKEHKASDLLRESTFYKFGHRLTEGIPQFFQSWIDSLSRSEDRIDGFTQ